MKPRTLFRTASSVVVTAMAAASGLLLTDCAAAQTFPTKPVRIIATAPPGGGLDYLARFIAQKLSQSWGQPVVVDNRGGAGGVVGTETLANSTPDGHTLAVVGSQFSISASVSQHLPYDALRDFVPVNQSARSTWVLVTHPSLQANTVKELIELAKKNPGKINYASTGSGGATHLSVELFKSLAGIDMVHIPYKGSAPAVTDVIGGRVQVTVSGLTATMPHVSAGKLRLLAVTGSKRSAELPNTPTIGETVPGYEYNNWFGFLAPKGTPSAIVTRLDQSILRELQGKEAQTLLATQGIEPASEGVGPAQFSASIRSEIAKFTKLAKSLNISVD